MASTSGTKGGYASTPWPPSRRITRKPVSNVELPNEEGAVVDSEIVPLSLAAIVPILRVANEIEAENPRVAYLCRYHAFEKAHNMDPTARGRGVRQFKTYLLQRLEEEGELTEKLCKRSDTKELQLYYQKFYVQIVWDGEFKKKPEEMAMIVQIATVLYDMVKALVPPQSIEEKTKQYAMDVDRKRGEYEHYNILPLYVVGVKPAIMELPEIKAAVNALCRVENLPMPIIPPRFSVSNDGSRMPKERFKNLNDIFVWLSAIFGFQKGNVANQREHLVLLLANIDIRNKDYANYDKELHGRTVPQLRTKIFQNYNSWCDFVRCKSNIKFTEGCDKQQLELIYIALYLLTWGEASNIRFMPECLCYIFHHMCNDVHGLLFGNVDPLSGDRYQTVGRDEESFLRDVITPIYNVLHNEAKKNNEGKASHSNWRNYDDLNEYFWSDRCFMLGWPLDLKADFFGHSYEKKSVNEVPNQVVSKDGKQYKTNFVEVRTFWHMYRSFDRMWIFLILALQAMITIAWSSLGPFSVFYKEDVFKNVMGIFITYAFLNFLQVTSDIILNLNASKSMRFAQLWYLLKFMVAAAWSVILPVSYFSFLQFPSRHIKFFTGWAGHWRNQSIYSYAVAIYLLPNIVAALLFLLPSLRIKLDCSKVRIIMVLMWWAQPKLFVGRAMNEDMLSLLKYTLFWILLLTSKLAFSYYVEISPLVGPTKLIMAMPVYNNQKQELFSKCGMHSIAIIIAIWAPIILVYFMDIQIWYAVFSTVFGGIVGAFRRLGEIRTLGMLHSRFKYVPSALNRCFSPQLKKESETVDSDESFDQRNIAYFSEVWNKFINSMREEDLISNRDRDFLLVPYNSNNVSSIQWPPLFLAGKISVALEIAKNYTGKDDAELYKMIKSDEYMYSAVVECYGIIKHIISGFLRDEKDKMVANTIFYKVETSIHQSRFVNEFEMSGLPSLVDKLEEFARLFISYFPHAYEIKADDLGTVEQLKPQIVSSLQDIVEIIIRDVMINGHLFLQTSWYKDNQERFENIDVSVTIDGLWREKVHRFYLILNAKESAINVPQNLDAQRRITFFANSLFMDMPKAPNVYDMLSFSVLTPYYEEDILYSSDDLQKEIEHGISLIFYLRNLYPDEWANFKERISEQKYKYADIDELNHQWADVDEFDKLTHQREDELTRYWASCRGQTLYRTVRGMMYYREALNLQCLLECAGEYATSLGQVKTLDLRGREKLAHDLADLKFTYVISCHIYGTMKKSQNLRYRNCYNDILTLMSIYPALRVAYIDETEVVENSQKEYYSVLVKGGGSYYEEEIYRIKLPGPPTIGQEKPEDQNHAIIFTRGEALQTIDMNQDNYFEEAFKMRNVLEEFKRGLNESQRPIILGLREHIFFPSVSSLTWFLKQDSSFATIGQRVLTNLRVRFHYGHPDIFDRIFHLTRGGISKASTVINLSQHIFAGFNSTLRGGFITHHEYIQVGKGRAGSMNEISFFETQVANGNGEQTLSRDVYRLGQQFDFFRMLSFYYTTVGFYLSIMVSVLTIYVFLYGRLYMVFSGVERFLHGTNLYKSKALEQTLAVQSVFQLGLVLLLPMFMEMILEKGFRSTLGDFIIMQLQLASVFVTFQLGTKAYYYGRTILHGGVIKYRPTGGGMVVYHASFAENYMFYSRSHFVKGLEILILLIVYQVYGESYPSSNLNLFITSSMYFLALSWLFAPFLFDPSGFDWQKTVDDWINWKRWIRRPRGIEIRAHQSWESWWYEENEHLNYSNIRGKLLAAILSFRFFVYQYGIVYRLNLNNYGTVLWLSWAILVIGLPVLTVFKTIFARLKFPRGLQLMLRILKMVISIGFMVAVTDLILLYGLTMSDLFLVIVAIILSGWGLIQVALQCRGILKKVGLWNSVKDLAKAYDYMIGFIIFLPIAILSSFSFVSVVQARLLFNQAISRRIQISAILPRGEQT